MSKFQIRVEVDIDDDLRITPPRMADSMFPDRPRFEVPWQLSYAGVDLVLAFHDVSNLVGLRDAITAALDEHAGGAS